MTAALITGILAAVGGYLVCQRGLVRVTLGFVLFGHAVNVLLLASGGRGRQGIPIIGDQGTGGAPVDPLPQAFVLTAIVIGFAMTAFLLSLAFRSTVLQVDDDVEAGGEALAEGEEHSDRKGGA